LNAQIPATGPHHGRANQIGFTALSEQHGGGFIVEADRLRGKFASCRIKTKKEDGQLVNIVAGCATDIMLSNVQFSLKVLEPNKISRMFPGIEDMEIYLLGTRMFMIMEVNQRFSFEAKAQADLQNPKVQEWENLMWKFQQSLPEAKPGEKWLLMERVFKLDGN
jgi:L-rhamnose mutarotase